MIGQRTVAEGVVEIAGDTRMIERASFASLVVAVGPIRARTRRRCNAARTGGRANTAAVVAVSVVTSVVGVVTSSGLNTVAARVVQKSCVYERAAVDTRYA